MFDLQTRVERGEKFLDVNHPGWYRKICVRNMDIMNSCHCVLGQLYGSYSTAAQDFGLTMLEAEAMGFYLTEPYANEYVGRLQELNQLWVKVIEERREVDAICSKIEDTASNYKPVKSLVTVSLLAGLFVLIWLLQTL